MPNAAFFHSRNKIENVVAGLAVTETMPEVFVQINGELPFVLAGVDWAGPTKLHAFPLPQYPSGVFLLRPLVDFYSGVDI